MKVLVAAGALLALAAAPAAASGRRPDAPCRAAANYARKADLPKGVVAALDFAIAERGGRYNATDYILPGSDGLPYARFVAARQRGCTIELDYNQGGRGSNRRTALLRGSGGAWTVTDTQIRPQF